MHRIYSLLLCLLICLSGCAVKQPSEQASEANSKPIALSKPRDLWSAIRRNLKLTDATKHQSVQKQIEWIKQHQENFSKVASNAAPYLYHIHHEVEKRDLPSELALLPMIESAYDPFAYSHAGAAGLWQLMPGTAMGFGLSQTWWYDGRRDLYASTNTALNYLSYLNNYFDGDWLLTIAAYDSGEGTVHNAIQRNLQQTKETDFWALPLPQETRSYIPRLLAISAIIKAPEKYGIELPYIEDTPYFAKVDVKFQMDLSQVATLAGVSKQEIYQLNPGYNRWATSPEGPQGIVLPIKNIEQFKLNLALLPKQDRVKWQHYLVQKEDTLSHIAQKFKVKLSELIRINRLKNYIIRKGQALIIPHSKFTNVHERLNMALIKQHRYGPKKIEYTAKKNERISNIAKKYSVKPAAIKFWNHLTGDLLKAPTNIVIWKSKSNHGAKFYIVQQGDNLGAIAKNKNLSLAELHKLNPQLKNKTLIKPKDKIRYA